MNPTSPRFAALVLAGLLAGLSAEPAAAAQSKHAPAHQTARKQADPESVAAATAVSRLRAAEGLPPVVADPGPARAARQQAAAMAAANRMSHDVGGDFAARLKAAGLSTGAAAENIAMGQASLAEAIASWTESSGHRRNMLMKQATRIGVAHARGSDGHLYWAMVLAAPEPPPRPAEAAGEPFVTTPFGGLFVIR